MTIVGIVVGIAVPSYRYVTNSNRVSAEINQLLGDMQYARSEAVKEGAYVSVCSSSDGATCLSSTTWSTGWIVFSDVNGNGTLDTGDQLLRAQPAINANDTLSASNSAKWITFNREGFSSSSGATGTVFTLKVNPGTNPQWERCLQLTYVGLTTTLRGGTSPCN
jgi:type IV fimbrial biogenesis protein FimT